MFSPRLLHAQPVALTQSASELPLEPVCEKKLFATMSCECASAACVSSGPQPSATAGAKLPPPRQSAPAARGWLMRASAVAAKSGWPQVEPTVEIGVTTGLAGAKAGVTAGVTAGVMAGGEAGTLTLLPPRPQAVTSARVLNVTSEVRGFMPRRLFMPPQAIGGGARQGR